jgi:benzoyl-CoA reductase subunit D
MITAGIDMGAKNIRVVILKDGEILSKTEQLAGFDTTESAQLAFKNALEQAGLAEDQIDKIVATGAGRESAPLAQETVTDVGAAAKGTMRSAIAS